MTLVVEFCGLESTGSIFFAKNDNFFVSTFTDFHMSCQKLDMILENKVYQKLKLSKNVNNKKHSPKLIYFNEKKTQ